MGFLLFLIVPLFNCIPNELTHRAQSIMLFSKTLLSVYLTASASSALIAQSPTNVRIATRLAAASDFERPSTFLDEDDIKITFIDESGGDSDEDKPKGEGRKRWENLNPKIKQRLVERGQEKAIANKKRREPSNDKKRRMMMHFKKLQQEKKKNSRVERPLGFDERAPLSVYTPGMEVTGTVISLTNYGAYIDVGTECDGLLHISQITRDFFVEHPRQALTPGEEVLVKVRSTSTELRKMQLTMLDMEESLNIEDDDDGEERIQLDEIEPDDELWGELKRVTDFGAYVEVGAEVDGFLHFMDHPMWDDGSHPSEIMQKGERVRVWVSDVDTDQRRIKLTGNRPTTLPGPRREL